MIKIDLITGFLGSGKTTFLIKYARYLMSQGLRIGILEYDYGAVNVDMLLLNKLRGKQCELEMVAAACDEDCLRRRFTTKLISMAMSGYDRIIVEPSGVFDMDMFFDALREEPLENWYEIGSVITIVNANLRDEMSEEEDFFLASQISSAGKIVFSRVQLSSEEKIENTKQHILRAAEKIHCMQLKNNFDNKCLIKNWDNLTVEDFTKLANSGYRIGDYAKTIAGQDLNFSSVYFLNLKDDLKSMKRKIEILFSQNMSLENQIYGNIIRVKGFVCDEGGGYQINASQYELLIDPVAIGQGVMIVIGTELNEAKIRELMEKEL